MTENFLFQSSLTNTKHPVRIVSDMVGDPWFVAHDVAELLEYKNSRAAISKHIDEEIK